MPTKDLSISLIQTHTHWHNYQANHEHFAELLNQVPPQSQVVVLPEMFNTGFTMDSATQAQNLQGPTAIWLSQQAKQHNKIIIGSIPLNHQQTNYNACLIAYPNGTIHHYFKKHLFTYANEHQHYTAGNQRLIIQVNSWKILIAICYDLRFPVWLRNTQNPQTQAPDYDCLISTSNWPTQRAQAYNILTHARAIENQAYHIACNRIGTDGNQHQYSGNSQIICPTGNTIHSAQANQQAILTHTLSHTHLQATRQQFPFLANADSFTLH